MFWYVEPVSIVCWSSPTYFFEGQTVYCMQWPSKPILTETKTHNHYSPAMYEYVY